jgi:hypothetical protein
MVRILPDPIIEDFTTGRTGPDRILHIVRRVGMPLLLLAAASVFRGGLPPAALGAESCYIDCMQRSGCWSGASVSDPHYCNNMPQLCRIQCEGDSSAPRPSTPRAPVPPRAASWGAIAYSSRDMGAGWSQGKDDRASAEKAAMAACAQRGKACVVRATFNKMCGALAADRDVTGSGTSTDAREAQQKALNECRKAGGSNCVLHILFCSL